MSFNPRDLQRMQQQMIKAQEQVAKAQEQMAKDLANMSLQGTAGGSAVVVTMAGDFTIQSVKIDPEAVDPEDVATLEELIALAFKSAIEQAQAAYQRAQDSIVSSATSGIQLPKGLGF